MLTKRHELSRQIVYLYRYADERYKKKPLKIAGENRVVSLEEVKKAGKVEEVTHVHVVDVNERVLIKSYNVYE